jgi:hypothetical protein
MAHALHPTRLTQASYKDPEPLAPLHAFASVLPFSHPAPATVPPSRSRSVVALAIVSFASALVARDSPSIPLSPSGLPCPRSPLFPMHSRSHRRRTKPPLCRRCLSGDPESHFEVRNLPCPLCSHPLLSFVRNCLLVFPSVAAEPPHHGPLPPLPLPQFSPHHWVPRTLPIIPDYPINSKTPGALASFVSNEFLTTATGGAASGSHGRTLKLAA